MKKYLKDRLVDAIIDLILCVIFVIFVLYLCDGNNYILGIVLAFFYSLGKEVRYYVEHKRS